LNILSIKTKKATILLRVISSVIVIIADNSWSNLAAFPPSLEVNADIA